MLKSIQRFFETRMSPGEGVTGREINDRSVRIATAALLIETARADFETKGVEVEAVARALERTFGLDPAEVEEILRLAEEEAEGSSSLYQFTRLIDRGYPYEKKKEILGLLWEVVYADGLLDSHEEYLVRKVADLLHLSHRDFIDTKLQARKGSPGGPMKDSP